MNIAIGIITRNRPKKLYRLLHSLAPQLKNNHKIFILENGSDTIDEEKIRKLGIKNFNLTKKKIGNIPISRNYLLSKVKNKYDVLLFIDDDCIASKDWIREYEKEFKNKKINIIQGAISSIPSNNLFANMSNSLFTLWLSKNSSGNTTKIIDTKNVGIRINRLQNTKFNEKIKFATDIELAVQLYLKNIKISHFNSSLIFHEEKTSAKAFIKHRIRLSGAYKNIANKYKNHFKSAGIIEKYLYVWKNLNQGMDKKIIAITTISLSYLFIIFKSIPRFSSHSKP